MAEEPIDFRQALKNVNPKFKIPKVELKLSRSIKILIVVIALLAMAYNLLFVYVRPNEYGIKVVRIGINRGVQNEFYTAGVHLVIPGFQKCTACHGISRCWN